MRVKGKGAGWKRGVATAQQGGSDGERGCGVRARGAVGLGGLHAGGFPAGNLGGFPTGSFGGFPAAGYGGFGLH